ncbi:MAG: uroporphyrinogen decarboxylase family protein [Patescibacteria group bacterium]
MKPRDRVRATFNREPVDRTPLDMGGTAGNLQDEVYFKLLDYLGIQGKAIPYRSGTTSNYYDERVLDALGIDFRRIWLNPPAKKSRPAAGAGDGISVNEWGIPIERKGAYAGIASHPMRDFTVHDLDYWEWPDPADPARYAGVAERARALDADGEYAISLRPPMSGGALEYGSWLRGFEQFLVDCLIAREFAWKLCEKIVQVQMGFYEATLKLAGPYLDMVEMASDYGTQRGLLISAEVYRAVFKPFDMQIISLIHRLAPRAKVLFHSCGAIRELIPDLLEAGVDVLNPLQPLAAGMDSAELKREFGHRVIFHGAIDEQEALVGSVRDVESEVRLRVGTLGAGGGYILAPANHICPDVPPENVVAMYRTAANIG